MGQKWICCERKRISSRISSLYPRSREYACDQERNMKAIPFITFVTFLNNTFGTDFVLHLGPYYIWHQFLVTTNTPITFGTNKLWHLWPQQTSQNAKIQWLLIRIEPPRPRNIFFLKENLLHAILTLSYDMLKSVLPLKVLCMLWVA